MNALESRQVRCPYCSERIDVLIDCSIPEQQYIEDCQVCCRPIGFHVTIGAAGELEVEVAHENE